MVCNSALKYIMYFTVTTPSKKNQKNSNNMESLTFQVHVDGPVTREGLTDPGWGGSMFDVDVIGKIYFHGKGLPKNENPI